MNQYDACRILNITGEYNPTIVKQAYRKASMAYHPDRNSAGHEMMQLVNQAYETLKDASGESVVTVDAQNYGADVCNALNAIMGLGLTVELCGAWAWVSGDTKPHKDTLKQAGFRWASKKKLWYYRPEDAKVFSRGKKSMEEIRSAYGSQYVGSVKQQGQITQYA